MRHLTKAQWKLAHHHYRHIAWMTRNYFAHKRSMGHRQTIWKMIVAAEKAANQPRELRMLIGPVVGFATAHLDKRWPSKERYVWLTATINGPDDPRLPERPHRLAVEDNFPRWHFVIGASPEHAVEMMAKGERVRWNHTVKLYCGYYKQWQHRLHAPAIAGKDDAPELSPALGGGR